MNFKSTCFTFELLAFVALFCTYFMALNSTLAGLRKAKAGRERLFWLEIRWRETSQILVEFEKFYVVAAHWKAAVSTVFLGQILRQATRTSARNYTVSETGEILMYVCVLSIVPV